VQHARLQVIDIGVRFGGVTAVDAVSLEVGPGELVGLIGPNGAGKTTTIRTLLDQTRPGLPGQQTMLGDALGLTVKTFENSLAEDRVLVLLTDGNDTGSTIPPRKAAEIAADHDITVHTVAVGDPTAAGEAQMDLAMLEDVAATTGGVAFQADDRDQLEAVYARIDALTPQEIETTSYRPTRPLFHWPLGGALLLLVGYQLGMAVATGVRHLRARNA